jgi:hypothetical protein
LQEILLTLLSLYLLAEMVNLDSMVRCIHMRSRELAVSFPSGFSDRFRNGTLGSRQMWVAKLLWQFLSRKVFNTGQLAKGAGSGWASRKDAHCPPGIKQEDGDWEVSTGTTEFRNTSAWCNRGSEASQHM